MADELVLTFPRTLLDEIGSFQGLCSTSAVRAAHPRNAEHRYVPRSLAETDRR